MELKDQIKIFFFDIDFTAFDHVHSKVRPLTIYALKKLKEKGYKLVISSARALQEMSAIEKEFMDLMDAMISLTGGLVFIDDKTYVNALKKEDIDKIIKYLDENELTYRYSLLDGDCYLNKSTDFVNFSFERYFKMLPEIKKYEGESLTQIKYFLDHDQERINKEIKELVPYLEIANSTYSNEISPKGIDKGSVIEMICKYYGLEVENAMAFGDSANDITMLSKAGFGVCMENGEEASKKVADYICEAQDKDGIYHTLVKYGFIDEYKFDEGLFLDLKKGMDEHLKQIDKIGQAGKIFAETIINDGVVQMLGIGKCEEFAQELFYRSGGIAPFNKLVYKNQSLDELLASYKLDDRDAYMLISDDGGLDILVELAKRIKVKKQKLIVVSRNNSILDEYADVKLELINSDNPLRYTIDDTLAQMLSAETYKALKKLNTKPLLFISNNKENAKEHNDMIISKYEGRIYHG